MLAFVKVTLGIRIFILWKSLVILISLYRSFLALVTPSWGLVIICGSCCSIGSLLGSTGLSSAFAISLYFFMTNSYVALLSLLSWLESSWKNALLSCTKPRLGSLNYLDSSSESISQPRFLLFWKMKFAQVNFILLDPLFNQLNVWQNFKQIKRI